MGYNCGMDIDGLIVKLKGYQGLERKSRIGPWAFPFRKGIPDPGDGSVIVPGDDAGAVQMEGGYILLSAEGVRGDLMRDPEFAGFCAVTVGVNDIYAMGGRPLGLVAVVFSGCFSEDDRDSFIEGMRNGLEHYGVPLLGGHTSPEKAGDPVAVATAGFAKRLLRGDGSRPGDVLLAALDLDGSAREELFAWDCATNSSGESTLGKLEAITQIAEKGIASACRDISNPGLVGTLAMMCEASRTGAVVHLGEVPVPEEVELSWWLKAYPAYGFLLAVPPENAGEVAAAVGSAGAVCARLGEFTTGSELVLELEGARRVFRDLEKEPVTGLFQQVEGQDSTSRVVSDLCSPPARERK